MTTLRQVPTSPHVGPNPPSPTPVFPNERRSSKDTEVCLTLNVRQDEPSAFDEQLRHYVADQRIHFDRVDGVKLNYGKFGDLLADVKKNSGE